jgi:hypothetical protein
VVLEAKFRHTNYVPPQDPPDRCVATGQPLGSPSCMFLLSVVLGWVIVWAVVLSRGVGVDEGLTPYPVSHVG